MKLLIIIIVVVCTSEALLSASRLAEEWDTFKQSHGRLYRSSSEEQFRKTIFSLKLQLIEEHNDRFRKGLESYEIGVNQFTDYTDEEMIPYTHGFKPPLESPKPLNQISSNYSFGLKGAAPASFDWRSKGVVTPIKNQGPCGSCGAFSAIAVLEAHLAIHYFAVTLSEQQLVDCIDPDHNGCAGISPWLAYWYIFANGGINSDHDYPYEAKFGTCRYQPSKPRAVIKGAESLPAGNEELLKEFVATRGPVSVIIDSTGNFGSYKSGVYYNPSCSAAKVNHAVAIVGYGNENGQDYWLVKNSWGTGWGENGYGKMARNRGDNCGITTNIHYPLV